MRANGSGWSGRTGAARARCSRSWPGAYVRTEALAAADPALNRARQEMEASTAALARADLSPEEQDAALATYASAAERFEQLGGYDFEHRAEAVRDGLGL